MSNAKHTPTPIPGPFTFVEDITNSGGSDPVNMVSYRIYARGNMHNLSPDYPCIGTLNGAAVTASDVDWICTALTAHGALVAALEDAIDRLASVDRMFHKAIREKQDGELGQITRGRAALKLAKGET